MSTQARRTRPACSVSMGMAGALLLLAGVYPSTAQELAPAAVTSAGGHPIAIVPLNTSDSVSGAMQVTAGTAMIATSGSITSGPRTTPVVLPHRGVLRVCASTTVKLAADTSVPAGDTPGLMIALDHGAVEASFATGTNSDVLLTPDFRILIGGGSGSADVKVRLGEHGDTCVDNPGANAPYVLVSSVFDGGAYRVQPGQRVMFQHGSLQEVVDQEKEPCGCPPEPRPNSNDFPEAQSAGLAPLASAPPAPVAPVTPMTEKPTINEPLVYQAKPQESAPSAPVTDSKAATAPPVAQPSPVPAAAKPARNNPGFFRRVGRFFRKIFGAD